VNILQSDKSPNASETVGDYIKRMRLIWKGKNPVVKLVTEIYKTGVKLTKQAMAEVENQIQRLTLYSMVLNLLTQTIISLNFLNLELLLNHCDQSIFTCQFPRSRDNE
jgi:hypothetical protein